MKLTTLITVGAICVATGAFQGANVCTVTAEDSSVSTDATLASQSVLEPVESVLEDAKDADCLDKGFDAETLDCRVCNLLALTLSLELEANASQTDASLAASKQLATENAVAKCQRCCTDVEAIDALKHTPQYARVVLEVCTCKFGRLPKIANFVHNHATKHARLEIDYINARMPHLIFYDDNGDKQEEISIASWDEETISEFIEAKLKPVEDEPTAEDEPASDDAGSGEQGDASEKAEDEIDEVVEVEVSADTQ